MKLSEEVMLEDHPSLLLILRNVASWREIVSYVGKDASEQQERDTFPRLRASSMRSYHKQSLRRLSRTVACLDKCCKLEEGRGLGR